MKRQNSFLSMGIVSLFLIFSVFCMVILCLLTFQTSRSDLAGAERAFAQTSAYYEGCTRVTDLSLELNLLFTEEAEKSQDEESFFNSIPSLALPETAFYDPDLHRLYIALPYSETQALFAEYDLIYPPEQDSTLSLRSWNSRVTGEWNPDLHQNVYLEGVNQ